MIERELLNRLIVAAACATVVAFAACSAPFFQRSTPGSIPRSPDMGYCFTEANVRVYAAGGFGECPNAAAVGQDVLQAAGENGITPAERQQLRILVDADDGAGFVTDGYTLECHRLGMARAIAYFFDHLYEARVRGPLGDP